MLMQPQFFGTCILLPWKNLESLIASALERRGMYPALGHFSFSDFSKLLLAEILFDKNNGLKE